MKLLGPLLALLVAAVVILMLVLSPDAERDTVSPDADETTPNTAAAPDGESVGLRGSGSPPPPVPTTPPPTSDPRTAVTITVSGADKAPVARALIRVLPDREGVPARLNRAVGTWRLDVPARLAAFPSSVWVEVLQPLGADGERLPLASAIAGPFSADERAVDVTLPVESVIEGNVRGADGGVAVGIRIVALYDKGPGRRWEQHGETVSADDGTFRIGGLRAGTHHLETWPVGEHAAADTLAVEASADDVVVQLRRGLIAELTIVDADGGPIHGTRVRAGVHLDHGQGFATSAAAAEGETDAAGRVRLAALDPERGYFLDIKAPYARKDVVPLTVRTWEPKSETFHMLRAMQVRGRCQYSDGHPFRGASVSVFPKGRNLFLPDGCSKKDGTWVVGGVPDGPVGVQALHRDNDGMIWRAWPVDAEAGATDVVLVMREDPVGAVVVRIEDWPEDAPEAWAFLTQVPEGRPAIHGGPPVKIGKAGRARFEGRGLRARYTFYAGTPDGKRCAYVQGLRPGDEPTVVTLQAAHAIRGRVQVPDGAVEVRVNASGGGVHRSAHPSEHGDFVIGGLPEGTYKVGASAKAGKRFLYETFEASTGDTLDLELE